MGPFGCVGQPTCVQRLEMIVKLGDFPTTPLFRTYAARREISPAWGSDRKVAMTNSPSGNAPIGPRSIARALVRVNAGRTAAPIAGSATPAAIRPPSPRVARSRKRLRGNFSALPAAVSVSRGAGVVSEPRLLPRIHPTAARSVIATPTGAITRRLTTKPTRMTAVPTANAIGASLGADW